MRISALNTFFGVSIPEGAAMEAPSTTEMLNIFEFLKPKPLSRELVRVGDGRDGTYLIPNDFNEVEACFSPGVNNFKTFEDILTDTYNISCHMCDYSSDLAKFSTPLRPGRQTFLKKWLDTETGGDSISLDDWVQGLSPNGDLILQMDIEGAEYRNILSASDETLTRFRIIILELHSLHAMKDAAVLRSVLAPFFERLSGFFISAHVHPNNVAGDFRIPGTEIRIPNLLELTLIRKDRVTQPNIAPALPHPQDIGRNVAHLPPLFLGDAWLAGPRSAESRIKMLEDRLDYVDAADTPRQLRSLTALNALLMRSLGTLTLRAAPIVDGATLCEIAADRPYVLSSSYAAHGARGKVAAQDPFFFHTAIGINQYIQIDLGEIRRIRRISIRNRTDACRDRAACLFAILSAEPSGGDDTAAFPLPVPEGFLRGTTLECHFDIPVTAARYVRITSPMETALHFSELRVYAEAGPRPGEAVD